MQSSERQWRTLSLAERVDRGEITVAEAVASPGKSRPQIQRIRERVAQKASAGMVHGNTGRSLKNSEELREQVLSLRRTRYAGLNDQHFTEKLAEVEQRILRR